MEGQQISYFKKIAFRFFNERLSSFDFSKEKWGELAGGIGG